MNQRMDHPHEGHYQDTTATTNPTNRASLFGGHVSKLFESQGISQRKANAYQM